MVKISEVLDSSEMSLLLSNNIMKRINSSSCEGKKLMGVLYGFEWKNEVIAVTFIITPGFEIFENDFQNIEAIFPSGMYPIGLFIIGDEAEAPDSMELPNHVMEHISQSLLRWTSNDVNCVVILGTDIHHDISSYAVNRNNDMKAIKHEFINLENMWNDYMLHHITGILKVSCPLRETEILKNLENLQGDVESRSVAFFLENDFFIRYTSSGDVECTTLNKEVTCEKTVQEIASYVPSNESTIINAKHKRNAMDFHHMNWRMNPVVTGSYVPDRILRCVPVINQAEEESPCLTLPIKLDCLAITHKTTTGKYLMKYLCQAVVRQLKCVSFVIKRLYAEGRKISLIKPYHFYPELCGHPLTLLYPQDLSESDLEPWRRNLHSMLCLPMDVPTVRRANEHTFDWHVDGYIKNPHMGLSSPKLNGEVALVRGDYTYHHYMQDKKDDKGWGCAYRSLQTLVSWFRFQGYTEKPIPSHKEIQESLVAMGDKPTSFIGSTQWIGSTEVSYVLDSLFGITSRILFVNSGEDMGSQGRELLHHFRTQGTPIMIGGGVLAHTILGVDFNCETGDINFLILDPHYTGEEDLPTVQNKGFCGWKNINFWDKKAHYNMCLPLRPSLL